MPTGVHNSEILDIDSNPVSASTQIVLRAKQGTDRSELCARAFGDVLSSPTIGGSVQDRQRKKDAGELHDAIQRVLGQLEGEMQRSEENGVEVLDKAGSLPAIQDLTPVDVNDPAAHSTPPTTGDSRSHSWFVSFVWQAVREDTGRGSELRAEKGAI
ncbi:hypothetical protein B0H16DRAFT_1460394 [Mycena metata]|uniref:Uncharacterized protein n=1 Tax=Mycena metata TaxID=1033252 RepID=A0AAD7IV17_9AGAR|nr:hypothetical protein B0H16DRAFT_1460394 [Mycena metata]